VEESPVDVALVISRRLEELGYVQKDLARAARVTESYISQLLTRKKPPPAPNRTDIYARMDEYLKLPGGELARLARLQRLEQLRRHIGDEPAPLFHEARELILRKCGREKEEHLRTIFEQEPFGELERLITQTLVDAVKRVARAELRNEDWLRMVARSSARSYEEVRVKLLDFLDTDVLHVSIENCVSFLDPVIESWDIDLATFGMEVVLKGRDASGHIKRFAFKETEPERSGIEEPGFKEFLRDPALSGTASDEELGFLRTLAVGSKQPTALYYYRELQNLRDPLHFRGR
jgi:transcriptional regulator with XRE-family HTH domain